MEMKWLGLCDCLERKETENNVHRTQRHSEVFAPADAVPRRARDTVPKTLTEAI